MVNQHTLPELRANLRVLEASPDETGSPNWLIYDPLRNSYFRISYDGFKILSDWENYASSNDFLAKESIKKLELTVDELSGFIKFLTSNQLTVVNTPETANQLVQAKKGKALSWWKWIIHNYLFIKIPLWRPDEFLRKTAKYVNPLFGGKILTFIRLIGAIGLVLALRQWEQFMHTFTYFFNLEGAVFYIITLMLLKTAHELGHAYTAHRLGVKVSSIGVAFLVMFPVMYTDTTDAWRLKDSRSRLKIVLTGVGTELHIAMIATFLWSFTPDGVIRSALFFIATTSWITSLTINASPFMRFDGYYALSDYLNIENLQPRSFALARWKLREILFGLNHEKPEEFDIYKEHLLIGYAWGTWIYRFFLFLGIAFIVYHFAFKLLGIILFVVEIIWFILLPIGKEIQSWWHLRNIMKPNKNILLSACLLGTLLISSVIPWKKTEVLPAIATIENIQRIYAPEPAQVTELLVNEGDRVSKGQVLIQFNSPQLEFEKSQTELNLLILDVKLKRLIASQENLEQRLVIEQELQLESSRFKSIEKQLEKLTIRAGTDGVINQLRPLQNGQWINANEILFSITPDEPNWVIKAFADDQIIETIKNNGYALWQPDVPEYKTSIATTIEKIRYSSTEDFNHPELLSDFGGIILSASDNSGTSKPKNSVYEITLAISSDLNAKQKHTGVVRVETEPHSWLNNIARSMLGVLIRESGF